MSKIVIGIACHKPSELPDNDIYLPIHVGAALAKKPLPGLQSDSEGDSISEKNPKYCELTAQYWLWKNVDADYYGLCHYRRFISFAPERFNRFTPDGRKQVCVHSLNERTMHDYYLDNEEVMHQIIESHDIVATEEQDLSKVWTPRGYQNTVYKHFAAHDRDLINVHDMDAMIKIVEEKYPQYASDMKEYLDNKYFRGFNCFVMKKELFFELCEYEFDVLAELEKVIDFTSYDFTRTRVYGFMAEILYSSFVYHKKKSCGASVYDAQMLYFLYSDPKEKFLPKPGSRSVVIDATKMPSFQFDVTVRSFLGSLNRSLQYDVTVFYMDMTPFYQGQFKKVFAQADNVTVRFVDWTEMIGAMYDVGYNYNDGPRKDIINEEFGAYYDYPQLLIPWVLTEYKRVVMFDWNLMFEKDWSALFDWDLGDKSIAAAMDAEWQGEINNIYGEQQKYAKNFLGIENVWGCFDTSVMVMDLEKLREKYSFEDVMRKIYDLGEPLEVEEVTNSIYQHDVTYLPQIYNARNSTEPDFKEAVNDTPLLLNKERQAALKDPVIRQYDGLDPMWMVGDDFEIEYWALARQSAMYESFLEYMMSSHVTGRTDGDGPLRQKINSYLPKGSKRRAMAKDLFPHGSKQYHAVKDFVRKLAN